MSETKARIIWIDYLKAFIDNNICFSSFNFI